MDSRERARLIGDLRAEAIRSLTEALKMSRLWTQRRDHLKRQFGDTHELFIAKRDDLRLKEFMAGYVWHRDNSSWANQMIKMLQETTVIDNVPAQR